MVHLNFVHTDSSRFLLYTLPGYWFAPQVGLTLPTRNFLCAAEAPNNSESGSVRLRTGDMLRALSLLPSLSLFSSVAQALRIMTTSLSSGFCNLFES